ncbi:membrane protein, partial [Actinomyces sp. S6-Spd3]
MGLDVARSLAIIGMIVIHMASLLWSTKVMLSGLPASLFAIIAGATMMIIGRNYTSTTFLRLIARGALIILIGLALLPVGGEIQVVLIVMGVVMMLVSWIPALGTWWRLVLFIAATTAATIVYAPIELPQIYPLLAWIAYFIGGMLLFDVYLRGHLQRDRAANTTTNTRLTWIVTAISVVIAGIGMYFRFDP